MSSPMELDSGLQDPQIGPQKSTKDDQKFNKAVLEAIDEYKKNDPKALQYPGALTTREDYSTLLLILLKVIYKEDCRMHYTDCTRYLAKHESLLTLFARAYPVGNFAPLVGHKDMPTLADASKCSPTTDISSISSFMLRNAFERRYNGGTAELFIQTLDSHRTACFNTTEALWPYNWSLSVVQSSGMGKSRMVEEAGNTVFTIPMNIREDSPDGRIGYPPPDKNMRDFLERMRNKPDEEQQFLYATLLDVIFTKAAALVTKLFPGGHHSELPRNWAEYLKAGQTDREVGNNRQKFYQEVIRSLSEHGSLTDRENSMMKSCETLLRLVKPDYSENRNACLMYFDEAHSLTEVVENSNGLKTRSPYHNLGSVLSKLIKSPIFFIFLSTNSRLKAFAPPYTNYPSARVNNSSQLIPPFTELCFDIHEYKVRKDMHSSTLEKLSETDTMVQFGRPLWYAHHKINRGTNNPQVFEFAMAKLGASRLPQDVEDAMLAALGIRVGIAFDATKFYAVQSRLVESHLRVVYSIPEHQEYMHTGSPSEPVLAEAAGRYLSSDGRLGMTIEGPKHLSKELEKGFLARGERRELVGRLLVTSAHDIALERLHGQPLTTNSQAYYHRAIPVLSFLEALVHTNHHQVIRGAQCVTRKEGVQSLEEAFSDSYVFFSHFALAEDSEMLSAFGLATALLRGMAIQAKDCQASIDAVIPVHMGTLKTPVTPKTTSAINLQFKNRKAHLNCQVHRSISIADATKPVISIIFELGTTGQKSNSVDISHRAPRITRHGKNETRRDDHHYEIVIRGCSSSVFGVIPPDAESQYRSLLGAGTVLEDFPRCDQEANVKALQELKPAFSGERQKTLYTGWDPETGELKADQGIKGSPETG